MTYIYDILLDFNADFYEFYEWEKKDTIIHIKKIPIFKVDNMMLDDLLTKKIQINDPFSFEILNKTEVFENKKIKTIKYAALFTDSYRVVAALLNDDLVVTRLSDLQLDEELDALAISKRCNLIPITYNIIGTKKDYKFLTRNEIKIKKYLLAEIKNAYKENDIKKLEYLYFEFFNKVPKEETKIIEELVLSLDLEVNDKHKKLYELMKLANEKQII